VTDGQMDGQNYDSQDRTSIARVVKISPMRDWQSTPAFNHSWPWPWPWPRIGSYGIQSCITTNRALSTCQISLK